MSTYVDTSVLLRLVFGEPDSLEELRVWPRLVASELLAVEALRTVDRLQVQGRFALDEAVFRRGVAASWLESIDLVFLEASILNRAAEPFPVALGTLDALHLATALAFRERQDTRLTLATHDRRLALAARAFGLEVVGVPA